MKLMRITLVLLATVFFIVFAVGEGTSKSAERGCVDTPNGYSSPRSLFDAFCAASKKRDNRTVFNCLTTEMQGDLVFEMYFACNIHPDKPQVNAVLKKYGPDKQAMQAEYNKRHLEKHKVDFAKVTTEYDSKQAKLLEEYYKRKGIKNSTQNGGIVPNFENELGPGPTHDQALIRQVVIDHIADKAGFYDEANRAIDVGQGALSFGELKDVRVQGETATGVSEILKRKFHFCKTKSGWLISGIE